MVRSLYLEYRQNPYSEVQIKDILAQTPGVGATHDGKLIGFLYFEPFAPDVLELGSVFIKSGYRDKGLGSALLAAGIEGCKASGINALIVANSLLYDTNEEKRSALNFYLANRFERVLTTGNTDVLLRSLMQT